MMVRQKLSDYLSVDVLVSSIVEMRGSILTWLWLYFLYLFYLCLRERQVLFSARSRVPVALKDVWSSETFEKARLYAIDLVDFKIVCHFYPRVMLSLILFRLNDLHRGWNSLLPLCSTPGWSYILTKCEPEVCRAILVATMTTVIYHVDRLPFMLYETFIIEESHGFNQESFGSFLNKFVKKFCVHWFFCCGASGLLAKTILYADEHNWKQPHSVVAFAVITVILLMVIYPQVMASLQASYKPLPEGPLRSWIIEFVSRVNGIPLREIYLEERSKVSLHSSACLNHAFSRKGILVIPDTLIKMEGIEFGCTTEEVKALVVHEVAHWKLHHSRFRGDLEILVTLVLGYLFTLVVILSIPEMMGTLKKDHEKILDSIIEVETIAFFTVIGCVKNKIRRYCEGAADAWAVTQVPAVEGRENGRFRQNLKNALIKIHRDNLIFPSRDFMYVSWSESEIGLQKRLVLIDCTQ